MKKLFLMAVLAIVSLTATAQIEEGSRWGMTIPLGLSSYSDVEGSSNVFGAGYEVIYEYNFNKNFYIGSGIGMGMRGTKIDYYLGNAVNGDLKTINVSLPINIGGRICFSEKASMFAQAGVYGSVIVKPAKLDLGRYEAEGESSDFGYSARVGFEFSKLQIFGGCERGIKEVWDNSKNNTVIFGVGYMF